VGNVSEEFDPCSRSSARTRCLEDIMSSLDVFGYESRTVSPSNSNTQMSPRLCPIPVKNLRTGACGSCDAKVQGSAHDCTGIVWLSVSPVVRVIIQRAYIRTFTFMASARTLASAQRLVRGGRMAVDPNIIMSVAYAS
jgi:hypothetical protein